MGDRVGVNRVSGAAPSLYLLGDLLRVRGSENAEFGRVAERVRQVVEESGDSLGYADRGKDAGAEKGVAAEAIVEGVLRAGYVRVDPREV
jgi:hypothetical protein